MIPKQTNQQNTSKQEFHLKQAGNAYWYLAEGKAKISRAKLAQEYLQSIDMFYICIVQYSSLKPHVATEHLKFGLLEEQDVKFNSHM